MSTGAVDSERKRLTALALELYLREGLEAVSFRRLAEAAGISHTLPYRYFDSKETLLVAIRVACTQHFDEYVRASETAEADPLTRIRRFGAAYVDFVKAHPVEYKLVMTLDQPAPDAYPELQRARRSLFEHAVEIVQHAIDEQMLSGNALALAHMFWASLHGLMTLHVSGQLVQGLSLESVAMPLIDRILSVPPTPGGSASGAKVTPIRSHKRSR